MSAYRKRAEKIYIHSHLRLVLTDFPCLTLIYFLNMPQLIFEQNLPREEILSAISCHELFKF